MVYPVSFSRAAACDLEIAVLVVLRQLLGRQPFPQEVPTAQLAFPWELIPIAKGSRPARARRYESPELIIWDVRQIHLREPSFSRPLAAEKIGFLLQ